MAEKGGVYVLDEPTTGLHLADVEHLLGLLDRLVDSGKSVIVIEHHQAVMAHADWIIDLGPGAGHDGGRIVFEGTPADLVAARSTLTGEHLAAYVGPEPHLRVTAMDITIHRAYLPHDDPDAALAFYRDTLGFEVRNDVEYDGMRWITVGPPDQPGTSIVLHPPAADPGITDDERRTIAEMMAKGTFASINLATADLDGTFARLQAGDADVVQEPTDQPYGVRDCAFRDPAGNLIRIQELRRPRLTR